MSPLSSSVARVSSAMFVLSAVASARAGNVDIDWFTIDCGGTMGSLGGNFELSGTIGQPDAGVMTGGTFELTGGFWGVTQGAAGVPAATLTAAVSRKANSAGPGGVCDVNLLPAIRTEARNGGIVELRLTFDVAPGNPSGGIPVSIEQAVCPGPPSYVAYSGASTSSATVLGNELVLTFAPALENARTYRLTLSPAVTSIPQSLQVRGLIGDANHNGLVNGNDRSVVIGIWTAPGSFNCETDLNNSGATNGNDRSIVIGAWTGTGTNCAP